MPGGPTAEGVDKNETFGWIALRSHQRRNGGYERRDCPSEAQVRSVGDRPPALAAVRQERCGRRYPARDDSQEQSWQRGPSEHEAEEAGELHVPHPEPAARDHRDEQEGRKGDAARRERLDEARRSEGSTEPDYEDRRGSRDAVRDPARRNVECRDEDEQQLRDSP